MANIAQIGCLMALLLGACACQMHAAAEQNAGEKTGVGAQRFRSAAPWWRLLESAVQEARDRDESFPETMRVAMDERAPDNRCDAFFAEHMAQEVRRNAPLRARFESGTDNPFRRRYTLHSLDYAMALRRFFAAQSDFDMSDALTTALMVFDGQPQWCNPEFGYRIVPTEEMTSPRVLRSYGAFIEAHVRVYRNEYHMNRADTLFFAAREAVNRNLQRDIDIAVSMRPQVREGDDPYWVGMHFLSRTPVRPRRSSRAATYSHLLLSTASGAEYLLFRFAMQQSMADVVSCGIFLSSDHTDQNYWNDVCEHFAHSTVTQCDNPVFDRPSLYYFRKKGRDCSPQKYDPTAVPADP